MGGVTTVETPTWFHWSVAVRLLAAIDLVPGESIDPSTGALSSQIPLGPVGTGELGTRPVRVVADRNGDLLIDSSAPKQVTQTWARSRFHLDIVAPPDLLRQGAFGDDRSLPVARIPAAMSPWAFCLTYLSGGNAHSEFTRRLFAAAGSTGNRQPSPRAVAQLSPAELAAAGVKASRLHQLRAVANQFLDEPDLDDPAVFRSLDPDTAVSWLRSLPRLGATRALHLAGTAFGHNNIGYDPVSLVGGPASIAVAVSAAAVRTAVRQAAPLRSMAADSIVAMLLRERD